MYIALGMLIALGITVLLLMFREQKAPVVNIENKDSASEIEVLKKLLDELSTRETLPHCLPEVKPMPSQIEDVETINKRILDLARKASLIHNSSYEPDQRVMAEREFKDLQLQITEDFRLIDVQNPQQETTPITRKKTIIA